ncbi:MAG: hypothetical protein MI867_07005 [Pseudomonadales bacterium]|nr:hypothetical protein [Pseudomonadales bacterium]
MFFAGNWLSDQPEKRRAEIFFLAYSPVWMVLMAVMVFTGWDKTFTNTQLLIHSLIVALPLLLVPAAIEIKGASKSNIKRSWLNSYWLKANLFIGIFGFFGNYFGSYYFFDVLGMVYNYPNATTNLDSALLNQREQPVPVIMYLYTHAYFMTYHTTANLVLRKINVIDKRLFFLPIAFLVGYVWAWIETKAMANPLMASSFYYKNMPAMLAYGSAIYACYFIVSFPIFFLIDERKNHKWSLQTVCMSALAASMMVFYLLDIAAHIVKALY